MKIATYNINNVNKRFDNLLDWLADALPGVVRLQAVLAGDYTVVPSEADIYQPHRLVDDALLQPQARHAFRRLLAQGWTDALSSRPPSPQPWTFWAYLRNRWRRGQGLRDDHLLLSPELAACLVAASVDRSARGEEGASDHAPTWIGLEL